MATPTTRTKSDPELTSRPMGVTGFIWDIIKNYGLALLVALVVKTSVVEAYKIPSSSMEDTLLVGDFLLANKFIYGAEILFTKWKLPAVRDPKAGDVVIFIFPDDGVTKYIKRCVAVGGDTVEIRNSQLYVNGVISDNPERAKFIDAQRQNEQAFVPDRRGTGRDNFGPYVIPANTFFMMGDNRDNSYDSRFWGTVPRANVLGMAMAVHWSWNEGEHNSPPVSLTDPLSVPRLFLFNAVHFIEKVRWDRLFRPIN